MPAVADPTAFGRGGDADCVFLTIVIESSSVYLKLLHSHRKRSLAICDVRQAV